MKESKKLKLQIGNKIKITIAYVYCGASFEQRKISEGKIITGTLQQEINIGGNLYFIDNNTNSMSHSTEIEKISTYEDYLFITCKNEQFRVEMDELDQKSR